MTRGPGVAHALRRARSAALARASAPGLTGADWAVLAVALLLCGLYLWRLDGWLINDDEGSYLYAAWRIAGGELPYRDFLTPQLPAFLLPGAAVLRLAGAGVWHLRALAAVLALGAGAATFWTARRLFGPRVAALAGTAAVAHPLVFAETRTYRPDPFMLFLAALGVALFVRASFPRGGADAPPARRWLAAAGAAFGLALLAKLFALLPLCACLAWLASDGRSRGRSTRALAADLAAVLATAGLVVAAGLGAFVAASGAAVFDAVLGHHLRQGAGMGAMEVAEKGLALASSFLRVDSNGLLVFTAAAAAVAAWRGRDRRGLFLAWQLPTVLAFFLMTRQLFPRHLLYLVPGLATLFAVEVAWLARGAEAGRTRPGADRERVLAAALAAGLLVPWFIDDWHRAWEWESGTRRAGDFLQLVTEPSDLVLADYSELNFYGRRATGSEIHRAFPLIAIAVTAIFICIQFSLPLSLGLLGALSIVRFRTPIKEPEEIGFLMVVIATSLPPFILALVLMSIFYVDLYWFAPERASSEISYFITTDQFRQYTGFLTIDGLLNGRPDITLDAFRHLAMPVFTLAIAHWATLGRVTRATMIEELQQDYVVAARARGVPQRRRHLVPRGRPLHLPEREDPRRERRHQRRAGPRDARPGLPAGGVGARAGDGRAR